MKLCFPVVENASLKSHISGHFGQAPLMLLVDTETQEIVELDHRPVAEQSGSVRLQTLLADQDIDAFVVKDIGPGAIGQLLSRNIKVYRAAAVDIADNILCLADRRLQPITEMEDQMHRESNGKGRGCGRNQGHAKGQGHGNGCQKSGGAHSQGNCHQGMSPCAGQDHGHSLGQGCQPK